MRQHTIESFTIKLQQLAKYLNTSRVNQRLGRKCREIIYRRVKDGYGVDSDTKPAEMTSRVRLKKLSPSYIAYREGKVSFFRTKDGRIVPLDLKKYAKKNVGGKNSFKTFAPELGEFGRPKKSNATFTGKMLKAIYIKHSVDGFHLIIDDNTREDGLTNKEVAEYYSDKRPFFALTAGEVRILGREIEKIIQEMIEKHF